MTGTTTRLTADQLLHLVERGTRYELVEGMLIERPLGGGEHGLVCASILGRLGELLDTHPEIGGSLFNTGTGFRIARNPDTVRAPDVAYVSAARLPQARVPGYPELAPDLVVEVVSPNDTASEIQRKVDDWLQAGVQLVWVLYPATRSAMVYRADGGVALLHEDDALDGEGVFSGFSCRLGDLF